MDVASRHETPTLISLFSFNRLSAKDDVVTSFSLQCQGGSDVLPYSEYFKSTESTGVYESTTNRI